MAELAAADVASYTKGRLAAADGETVKILARALIAVRTYCEWHVTPPKLNHTVTLDGPGGRILMLPTMFLSTLHSVVENGVALDVSTLRASASGALRRAPILLYKRPGQCWTREPAGIVVEMTHGFAEVDAEDWRMGVLDACDRFSQNVGNVAPEGLKRYDVDDVKREWFDPRSGDFPHRVINERLVEPYRLFAPV